MEITQPKHEFYSGVIKEIVPIKQFEGEQLPLGTDPDSNKNFIVEIAEGDEKGKSLEVYSNSYQYNVGDRVFIQKTTDGNFEPYYNLNEKDRTMEILGSVIIFVLFVVLLFGKKGFKSIISLIISFTIIFTLLIPMTLQGYNPILVAGGISFLLLSTMMLVTNGRNQVTYSAIIGCTISIFITIILSYITVEMTSITGKVDESWSYFNNLLNLNLNFSLIVIAGMIIGVIGAVDDAAITQASVVQQLKVANPNLTNKEYYMRAMQVGRDHAGAMVNTLILAYVASAIPLLMMIYKSPYPLHILINQEIVATEIFRMTIGSIGLLLAIPLTTLISVYLLDRKEACNTHAHLHNNH